MVKFEYQPWDTIVVHDVVKFPLEHFLATHSLGVPEGGIGRPLNWSDGIVFEHVNMPPTEDIIKEQIQGKLHWIALSYGVMDDYKEVIERPKLIKIPIINLSNNVVFHAMTEWIKENFEKT